MNTLLLYIFISLDIRAQEPIRDSLLEQKQEESSLPVLADEEKTASPSTNKSSDNTSIEGLSPKDNEMIQLRIGYLL